MLYDDFKEIQNSLLPRQDDFGGSKRVLYPEDHAYEYIQLVQGVMEDTLESALVLLGGSCPLNLES
jgi:hypothetical protein